MQYHERVWRYKFKNESLWKVKLSADNSAELKKSDGTRLQGYWTMVYDEGFAVNFPGLDFFNFFMYLSGTRVSAWLKQSDSRSICGRTMVGWYNDLAKKKIGCFYGLKKSSNNNKITYASNPVIEKLRTKSNARLIEAQSSLQEQKAPSDKQKAEAMKIAQKYLKADAKDIPLSEL